MDNQHTWQTVLCEHCGHVLTVPIYCKNRFCNVCGNHRNRVIRHKLQTIIDNVKLRKYDSFKFLTLTIRNQSDIQQMTTDLIKSFRMLRQRSIWKKHVRGGVVVIEAKPGKDGYHVHLHIVIESAYISFDLLLSEWKAVSTGQGVYVKKLYSKQVIGYLTKYLTLEKTTLEEQKQMTVFLKGRRLFQPFGTWYDIVKSIKGLIFPCPACDSNQWFFGNHRQWLRSTFGTHEIEHETCERSPPKVKEQSSSFSTELKLL